MKQRDQLYKAAILLLDSDNPHKKSILYHNIYTLKMSGNYLFSSEEDVKSLVDFLNSCES